MTKTLMFCLAVVCALAVQPTAAADVVVVAHPGVAVSEVSAADLKEIFLGTKTAVGGSDVQPVLAESGAAHEAFLKSYVGKSEQALKVHFKSLVFTGKGSMPKSFASDAEIVKFVAATKGAIGYVSAGAEGAGVKTLAVK
jgi:ABC-type phosphate transport system substrate-binding protein